MLQEQVTRRWLPNQPSQHRDRWVKDWTSFDKSLYDSGDHFAVPNSFYSLSSSRKMQYDRMQSFGAEESQRAFGERRSAQIPSCIEAGLQYSVSEACKSTQTRLSDTRSSMTATALARSQARLSCNMETVT